VAVTAQDGGVQRYLLDVRRQPPERDADLRSLVPAVGTLSPAFRTRVASYTLRLPPTAEVASLSLSTAGRRAAVSVDPPATLADGNLRLPIGPGQTLPLRILVTAEDGSQRLYRINVVREDPAANTRLALLQFGEAPLRPAFDPAVISYEARVPSGAAALELTARPENPEATVTLEGLRVPAGGLFVGLGPGAGPALSMEVKAPKGAVGRYTLRLFRETAAPESVDLLVSAQGLKLGEREISALAGRKETIGAQALITVRAYRSGQVLVQAPAAVTIRAQGPDRYLSLEKRVGRLASAAGGLVEVETAIPTSAGRYLCYTEALTLEPGSRLQVPFLLLDDDPGAAWPAIGSPVAVSGCRSLLPPGSALGGGEFEKNGRGQIVVGLEILDPETGALLGRESVGVEPGSGRVLAFERPLQLREGARVVYRLTAKARDGRTWQAVGTTRVWTTAPAYGGGFLPALLPVVDQLREP
jgi:hypothetical protein